MTMTMIYIVVFITVPTNKLAGKIAQALVKEKLAACVNAIPLVDSTYWWKGKIAKAREVLLIAKTERRKLNKLIRRIKQLHGYTVPEIIALPIIGGNKDYLDWITESLK